MIRLYRFAANLIAIAFPKPEVAPVISMIFFISLVCLLIADFIE
jgi:hypothetical protein